MKFPIHYFLNLEAGAVKETAEEETVLLKLLIKIIFVWYQQAHNNLLAFWVHALGLLYFMFTSTRSTVYEYI